MRVYCTVCEKGLERKYKAIGSAQEQIDFMVAHMTNYKVLSAHHVGGTRQGKLIRPVFAISTK